MDVLVQAFVLFHSYIASPMCKKFFVPAVLLLLLFIAPTLRAQYSSTWLGIRAGASLAGMSFDSIPDGASTGLKFGVLGGLTLEHWFDESWAINIGAQYVQKGIHEEYAQHSLARPLTQYGNDDFSLGYIEVPVTVKMAFGTNDFRPYAFVGPSFGFLMSASETVDGTITPITDLKSNLQSMDISLYFGLGLMDRVYQGPTYFFDAGYAAGLTKIFKSAPSRDFQNPIDPSTAKSSNFRLTMGAMWQI